MTHIEEISTDDLVTELVSRAESIIIAAQLKATKSSPDGSEIHVTSAGPSVTIHGLLWLLNRAIEKEDDELGN